jgi:hypothetical protein
MTETHRTQEGYLALADISGYTAFLTGTELEHAQAIMEELISLILGHIQPPLKLVKLEGDAVFFYAPEGAFLDGERLFEVVEACYFAFSDHLVNMHRATSCTCAACKAIPSLDLKFMAHYGQYLIQRLGGVEDLAGGDVILLHRLLKNQIVEQHGVLAYLFLTDACLARIGKPLALQRHGERYEHLGEVAGGVYDLKAAWRAMTAARRVYLAPNEAEVLVERWFPAPPAVLWDYLVNPEKNITFGLDLTARKDTPGPGGRMGRGSKTHCAHGKPITEHVYLDWRPFHYFTERIHQSSGGFSTYAISPIEGTYELTPNADGATLLSVRYRILKRSLLVWLIRPLMRRGMHKHFAGNLARLAALLEQERDQWSP